MLDQTVTFEDVSAETIAMEFVQFEDVDADTLAMEHFDDMKTELCMDSVWSIWEAAALSADDLLFQDLQYLVRYQFVRSDSTCEEIYDDLQNGTKSSIAEVTMFAVSGVFLQVAVLNIFGLPLIVVLNKVVHIILTLKILKCKKMVHYY